MIAIGQFYRHYKNQHVYRVMALPVHTETRETMVVYQDISDETKIWARPLELFEEEVEWQGKRIKRFTPVSFSGELNTI